MSDHLQYNEPILLQQVANGDEKAFATLFHLYRLKLYSFIYRFARSSEIAEDVVQDVFFKIWLNRESLREVQHFSSYLFRMAQNHAINSLRRMASETIIIDKLLKEQPIEADDPAEKLLFKEIQEKLRQAIEGLPPQQKMVYLLGKVQGLKQEEIAQRLNLSASTVKNHMLLAVNSLRKQLVQTYPDLAIVYMIIKNIL